MCLMNIPISNSIKRNDRFSSHKQQADSQIQHCYTPLYTLHSWLKISVRESEREREQQHTSRTKSQVWDTKLLLQKNKTNESVKIIKAAINSVQLRWQYCSLLRTRMFFCRGLSRALWNTCSFLLPPPLSPFRLSELKIKDYDWESYCTLPSNLYKKATLHQITWGACVCARTPTYATIWGWCFPGAR